MQVKLRPLDSSDAALLRQYLCLAVFVPEGEPPLPPEAIEQPALARYVANWGRPGDHGLLAVEEKSGSDVGAAWLRKWSPGETGYGFIDYDTPELSMAVRPAWRGQGVGTLLLQWLMAEADERYPSVSLSISRANRAARLYERSGFEAIASTGGSTTMRRVRPAQTNPAPGNRRGLSLLLSALGKKR